MEFKSIRPSHKKRLVKIYVETDDRNAAYRPSCSLIYPMMADRMLDTPYHACRFVSLIPFQRIEDFDKERIEVWHSIQAFLTRGCGDAEDHAVLLCNLLLGFGLDAYVCIGTNSEGSHAWVMTMDSSSDITAPKANFWE
jgi:centrosomal protein CEP76